jgi:YD repeat-containing protein
MRPVSTSRRVMRRWVNASTAVAAGAALFVALPPTAALAAWTPATPADVRGVLVAPGQAPGGRPAWSADAHAVRGPRAVTWPSAGSATVDLTAAQATATATAGGLPVKVGQGLGSEGDVPSARMARKVTVTVADRAAVARTGMTGVMLAVGSADKSGGRITLSVDYSGFEHAYGGDYGSRLRLVRLPDCALSKPEVAQCQRGTPVPTSNDHAARTLGTELNLSATAPTVLMVTAAASGDNGDYTATDLSPSETWQVSAGSGDFAWSYPMRTPPGLGGPVPAVGITYASGSVDGLTSTTNNQGSWIGDGWSFWPGSIDRIYNSCTDDNPDHKTGDRCWLSDNATLSLNGHAGELIRSGNTWRLKKDDGTRIERLTDPARANGDNDNEYWKVTTTDGTQFYFGYNRLPWSPAGPDTNSTWTLPVNGDDDQEPCHGSSFAASFCTQAWRWNLDYVVDAHGNATAYYYTREAGAYARDNTPSQRTGYDRGGYLERIEYGLRRDTPTAAPLRVLFNTAERCLSGCWTGTAWASDPNPSAWPDTPWDQYCKAGPCTTQGSPTFWTARRLASVVTQVRNGSGYAAVDSWTLRHEFLNAGNGEGTPMWLRGVVHTGMVTSAGGGAVTEPETTFDPGAESLPNRVDGGSVQLSSLARWRIKTVTTASGGQVLVTYSPASDCSRSAPPDPANNTSRCMPAYRDAAGTAVLDWFHRYVVTRIDEDDLTTDQPTEVTSYDYLDAPAWHYTTDEITKDKFRTWSEWRGYGRVRIRHGDPNNRQTATEVRYLRGMDGDRAASGVRDVHVTDSWGGSVEDHEALQGFELEKIEFDGLNGPEISSTVKRPWRNGPTATRNRNGITVEAWMTAVESSRTRTALASGGFRTTQTASRFNSDGFAVSVDDLGDEALSGDETCTRTTYARNDGAWMIDKVAQTETLSVACAAAATPAARSTVLSRERSFYDSYTGDGSFGAPPTHGDLVRLEALDAWNGDQPVYVPTGRYGYDGNGRQIEAIDARGNRSTTGYSPANGGLVVETTVTNPRGHITVTTLDPAWGKPVRIVSPNGEVTDLTYDGLGNLTAVWLPGRDRAAQQSPNMRHTYLFRNAANQPTAVTSETLLPSGSGYRRTVALFDGWWRERQTQAQATGGGRLITDTHRDWMGNTGSVTAPYYDRTNGAVSTTLVYPQETVPSVTLYSFDGAGRQTEQLLVTAGVNRWRTTTRYAGDRIHVTPPSGGTATTSIRDARGNEVELRQYRSPALVGSTAAADFQATSYTYDLTGALRKVRDPAGNEWKYDYDLRGRQTDERDPDKGATHVTYDAVGNVLSTTSALNHTLWNSYDELNRKTSVRDGSASGPLLAEWTYDTLPNGKGRLTSSTRWVNSAAYTTRIDSYDTAGRPTATSLELPASAGALCASGTLTPCVYTTRITYKANGDPYETTLPAAGDLPAEKMRLGYTDVGAPNTLISDLASYVYAVTYNKLGMIIQRQLGRFGSRVVLNSVFDEPTKRLVASNVQLEQKPDAADYRYAYDDAGNVTRISDVPAGQPADDQCYRYDHVRRMTEAWTPASGDCAGAPSVAGLQAGAEGYWTGYTYDVTGNR